MAAIMNPARRPNAPRNGKPQVTDGPYAEDEELVGGFFIIEAADRDGAVQIASGGCRYCY